MHSTVAGGHFDRCGAVVGGEVIAAGEATNVADETEHGGGDNRSDAVHFGDGCAGAGDDLGQAPFDLAALAVDALQINDQVAGQFEAGDVGRSARIDRREHLNRLWHRDSARESARHEIAEHRVQSTHGLSP
jgi:hypothetical protein